MCRGVAIKQDVHHQRLVRYPDIIHRLKKSEEDLQDIETTIVEGLDFIHDELPTRNKPDATHQLLYKSFKTSHRRIAKEKLVLARVEEHILPNKELCDQLLGVTKVVEAPAQVR